MAGRPRSADIDAVLAVAVTELLAERGYSGTTLNEVAARAGVAKTALYRRWASKAEMVFSVAVHRSAITAPGTGSLAADLVALSETIVAALSRPAARTAVPGLLDGLLSEPELAARFRSDYIAAERRVVASVLDAARSRGELVDDGDPVEAVEVHAHLLGAVFARVVIFGDDVTPDLHERLAAGVLATLTDRPRRTTP